MYILASQRNGTLYVGVTGNLSRRIEIHKADVVDGFTERYLVHDLVYYKEFDSAIEAIAREKQIKNWKRVWKLDLIERGNKL